MWLARRKYGIRGTLSIDHKLTIKVNKTQVQSMLVFEVVSIVIAPMLTVILFDEACLRSSFPPLCSLNTLVLSEVHRYYLSFTPTLHNTFESMQLGLQGSDAYRRQFCSRRLTSEFAYVCGSSNAYTCTNSSTHCRCG